MKKIILTLLILALASCSQTNEVIQQENISETKEFKKIVAL
jgi:uncharacterized lipoprotein